MIGFFDFGESASMFFYIMVSFGFCVGIILMAAPELYDPLNRALQREFGLKKVLIPKIEKTTINIVDRLLQRNMVLSGALISSIAFTLMIVYR